MCYIWPLIYSRQERLVSASHPHTLLTRVGTGTYVDFAKLEHGIGQRLHGGLCIPLSLVQGHCRPCLFLLARRREGRNLRRGRLDVGRRIVGGEKGVCFRHVLERQFVRDERQRHSGSIAIPRTMSVRIPQREARKGAYHLDMTRSALIRSRSTKWSIT